MTNGTFGVKFGRVRELIYLLAAIATPIGTYYAFKSYGVASRPPQVQATPEIAVDANRATSHETSSAPSQVDQSLTRHTGELQGAPPGRGQASELSTGPAQRPAPPQASGTPIAPMPAPQEPQPTAAPVSPGPTSLAPSTGATAVPPSSASGSPSIAPIPDSNRLVPAATPPPRGLSLNRLLYMGGDWLTARLVSVEPIEGELVAIRFSFSNPFGSDVTLSLEQPNEKTYLVDDEGRAFNFVSVHERSEQWRLRPHERITVTLLFPSGPSFTGDVTLHSTWNAWGASTSGRKRLDATLHGLPHS